MATNRKCIDAVSSCCQNDPMIIEGSRVVLRALTREEAEQIVTEDRTGQSWAEDYPTSADVGIAAIALAGRAVFPTEEVPWGLFVIVETSSALSIGGIGFKGTPNERGEVEIGYGVSPSCQGRGVASDAVLALCEYSRGRVGAILADSDRDNVASQRVLEKCGFRVDTEDATLLHWRRDDADAGR
jgi:RimJ/RimL family protein N-acetyltransferase